MTNIYLVRHGQCHGNATHTTLDPWTDSLTSVGKAQAECVGAYLKHTNISRAYSSDYLRAQQTATIILEENEYVDVSTLVIDKRLREMNIVQNVAVGQSCIPSETFSEFKIRITSFFLDLVNSLKEAKTPENILVVTHGVTIIETMRMFRMHIKEIEIDHWTHDDRSENLLRNACFHKINLEFFKAKENRVEVKGMLEFAHFRKHLGGSSSFRKDCSSKV